MLRTVHWRNYAFCLGVGIDLRLAEFPGTDPLRKEDIQLFICPVFWLWQSVIRPQRCQRRGPSPEEARFTCPVPCLRIELVLDEESGYDIDHLVCVPGQHYCLRAQSHGTCLRDDAVCDWADGQGVREEPYERERGLTPFTSIGAVCCRKDTY